MNIRAVLCSSVTEVTDSEKNRCQTSDLYLKMKATDVVHAGFEHFFENLSKMGHF